MTPTQQFYVEIGKLIAGVIGGICTVITVYLQLKTKAKVNDLQVGQNIGAAKRDEIAVKVADIHDMTTTIVQQNTTVAERQVEDDKNSK